MKSLFRYIQIPVLVILLFSCKKDNFTAPASTMKGYLIYNADTIQVEKDAVPYQIYQDGFGKVGAISASNGTTFAQDGSFSAALFDGTYKVIIPTGQGPFLWKQTSSGTPDTLIVTLNGSQAVNFDVTPYYMIRNAQITVASGKITANFKAEKVITDANAKDIESVSLYINKTQFVSENADDNIALQDMAGSAITDPANISLNVTIPALVPAQNYVFARIGLKIAGVEDRIFSPVLKLSF